MATDNERTELQRVPDDYTDDPAPENDIFVPQED